MLYLIGLGLNENGISLEGKNAVDKCKKIYLEGYTVDFPYKIENLEKVLGKKVEKLLRGDVESNRLVKESKKEDIALLVYGCPLFATTHMGLLLDCANEQVKTKIVYSASVFDAVAETGLQLYKFGKISSMPRWQRNFEPDSFLDFPEQNKTIGAHSLILVDIGLDFEDALNELQISCEKRKIKMDKIIVCSSLGTDKNNVYYGTIEKLTKKKVVSPYCFIIPGEMHFMEKEGVERFEI